MALRNPNTERVRHSTDSTVADNLNTITRYVNANVAPKVGNRRAVPSPLSHPVTPKS